ncbi:hypothetical protein E4U38_002731 [Claviceps purpurea]|nr:hypothetical protein E4U38_002731 [Claviceps purpurea]
MLPTTIRSPPSLADYTPLAEYQSQTPESFSNGKSVLHFHLEGAAASIPASQRSALAIFPADSPPTEGEAASTNGDAEQTLKQTVDVFVHSENCTIFCPNTESGVSIPYPSISIHAVTRSPAQDGEGNSSVWMQLDFADGGSDDDDFNTVELTISPADSEDAQKLYDAVANCSNLHPDPAHGDGEDDDCDRIVFESSVDNISVEGLPGVFRGAVDGGLPPPMPGSGGWITADNVHEFFDEQGNWVAGQNGEADEGEELGDGAGRTRQHDEVGGDINGVEDSESKRVRVE